MESPWFPPSPGSMVVAARVVLSRVQSMQLFVKLLLSCVSFFVFFIFVNLTFPFVFHQQVFPRGLLPGVGQFQYTLYPDTYDRSHLDSWVAIVGDSYGQGMGDAFLDGDRDYSAIHHLHEKTGRSYLIFARSGYGSINAARQLVVDVGLMTSGLLYPHLTKPDEIVLMFYEGNDLENNLRHLQGVGPKPEDVRAFVRSEILRGPLPKDRIDSQLPFALFPIRYVRKLLADPTPDRTQRPNHLARNGEEARMVPVQGAAMGLSDAEVTRGLWALDASLEVLQEWSPSSRLIVVYLPSVATSYDWPDPLEMVAYEGDAPLRATSEENLGHSRMIRERMETLTRSRGIQLIDTTEGVRAVARTEFLHGPKDWDHTNARGYEVIADIIVREL